MRKRCPFCNAARGKPSQNQLRPFPKSPCQSCIADAVGDREAEAFLFVRYGISVQPGSRTLYLPHVTRALYR